jgi:uncharacterized protein (DUF169 family)
MLLNPFTVIGMITAVDPGIALVTFPAMVTGASAAITEDDTSKMKRSPDNIFFNGKKSLITNFSFAAMNKEGGARKHSPFFQGSLLADNKFDRSGQ